MSVTLARENIICDLMGDEHKSLGALQVEAKKAWNDSQFAVARNSRFVLQACQQPARSKRSPHRGL